jgi:hypothetical protein
MIPGIYAGGAMGSGGASTDPYWANVVSLLHFDGPDGSTTITDQRSHAWTAIPPAEISTAQSKFGGSSALFTPSTIGIIQTSTGSADWDWGTGDFTIEAQVYFTGTARCYIFDLGGNVSALIITPSSGLVEVYGPGSWVINTGSTPFATGQWYALALVREGNDWTLYRDGVAYVTATDSRSWGSSISSMAIGASSGTSAITVDGFIDEWRVTKGVARYTGAYTPQSAPFPNS